MLIGSMDSASIGCVLRRGVMLCYVREGGLCYVMSEKGGWVDWVSSMKLEMSNEI